MPTSKLSPQKQQKSMQPHTLATSMASYQ